jgi:hypothetical protein
MAVSKRKLAANRANAKKSTGPKSPETKEKVSQNRTRHGLCGRFQVLSYESQEAFDNLLERLLESEQPANESERELVVKMARHSWLSHRCSKGLEACFQVRPRSEEDIQAGLQEIAVLKDIELYSRYQVHNDRAYARASSELIKRRKDRELRERGFERQKRAQAAEQRRDAAELRRERAEERREELHKITVAKGKAQLETTKLKGFLVGEQVSKVLEGYPPDARVEFARMMA